MNLLAIIYKLLVLEVFFIVYRCAIWIENCGSKYLPIVDVESLKKHYKLCALHFEDRMFNFQKNGLLSHAVPTIFKS